MKKPSFLLQFLLVLAVLVLASQTFILLIYNQKIRGDFRSETVASSRAALAVLTSLAQDKLQAVFETKTAALAFSTQPSINNKLLLFNPDGRLIADSEPALQGQGISLGNFERWQILRSPYNSLVKTNREDGHETLYYFTVFRIHGKVLGFLALGTPFDRVDAVLKNLFVTFLSISLALLITVFGLAFFYSRAFSRNIQRLIRNSTRFAQGLEYEKVFVEKPWELQLLAKAMNSMFDQLQDRIGTIRRQKNQFEAILEGMVEAVVVLNSRGKILTWNAAASRIFPVYTSPSGQNFLEVTRNSALDAVVRQLLNGEAKEAKANIHLHDLETTLSLQGAALYNNADELWGCVLVMSDISQLVRLEAVRRDFVANVSHELKTPITNILGYVETLEGGALGDPDKAKHFLKIISRHAQRLNLIIEDLLILSKIENQQTLASKWEFAVLQDVMTGAANVCHKKLTKKKILLAWAVPENEVQGYFYPLLLEQALVNLLDNAVKFSSEGSQILLGLSISGGEATLFVEDQGPGIPEKEKERIFERFYRTERGREKEGTGLGLSIVKHIIVLHRGRVQVESPPPRQKQGTRFSLIFPCQAPVTATDS